MFPYGYPCDVFGVSLYKARKKGLIVHVLTLKEGPKIKRPPAMSTVDG